MDIYKADVRLNGRLDQVVKKKDLTAAEIVVLRGIHGHDAVVNVEQTGSHQRPYEEEYERLCQSYGDKVCEAAWPGSHKVLPASIDEIQVVGEQPKGYTVVGSNFGSQTKKAQAKQLENQMARKGMPYKQPQQVTA